MTALSSSATMGAGTRSERRAGLETS